MSSIRRHFCVAGGSWTGNRYDWRQLCDATTPWAPLLSSPPPARRLHRRQAAALGLSPRQIRSLVTALVDRRGSTLASSAYCALVGGAGTRQPSPDDRRFPCKDRRSGPASAPPPTSTASTDCAAQYRRSRWSDPVVPANSWGSMSFNTGRTSRPRRSHPHRRYSLHQLRPEPSMDVCGVVDAELAVRVVDDFEPRGANVSLNWLRLTADRASASTGPVRDRGGGGGGHRCSVYSTAASECGRVPDSWFERLVERCVALPGLPRGATSARGRRPRRSSRRSARPRPAPISGSAWRRTASEFHLRSARRSRWTNDAMRIPLQCTGLADLLRRLVRHRGFGDSPWPRPSRRSSAGTRTLLGVSASGVA